MGGLTTKQTNLKTIGQWDKYRPGNKQAVGSGGSSTSSPEERFRNWEFISGNNKLFTYYTTITTNNPSGNRNIATAEFRTGSQTILTQTFVYNLEDDIISITTL